MRYYSDVCVVFFLSPLRHTMFNFWFLCPFLKHSHMV